MNNLPLLCRSGRGLLAFSLLGLFAAASFSGCLPLGTTSPSIDLLDTAIGSDGALHVMARVASHTGEGDELVVHGYAYARSRGGTTETSSTPLGADETFESNGVVHRLVIDGQGRPIFAAEGAKGLYVQALDGATWKSVPLDPSLSQDAMAQLQVMNGLGGAWVDSKGAARVMYGAYVYTIGENITSAKPIGSACALFDDCNFDPTGDVAGQAAQYDYPSKSYKLRQLDCDSACSWHDVGSLGDSDQGGSSDPLNRIFFHTADGNPTLVRRHDVTNGHAYAVIANTPATEITVLDGNVYQFGAAPRPDGGFVVAARDYDDQLKVAFVGVDGSVKVVDLGGDDWSTQPIRVHVTTAGGERAHVIVRESGDHVRHFTVSESGEFDRESIGLAWELEE